MPFKKLTELYFENKVQVIPDGAISFFGYLDEIDRALKIPGIIAIAEADILSVILGATKVTIVAIEGKGENKVSAIDQELGKLITPEKASNAFGSFFNIIGNPDITLFDVNAIAESVYGLLKEDAEIVFGATADEKLNNSIRLLLVLAEH